MTELHKRGLSTHRELLGGGAGRLGELQGAKCSVWSTRAGASLRLEPKTEALKGRGQEPRRAQHHDPEDGGDLAPPSEGPGHGNDLGSLGGQQLLGPQRRTLPGEETESQVWGLEGFARRVRTWFKQASGCLGWRAGAQSRSPACEAPGPAIPGPRLRPGWSWASWGPPGRGARHRGGSKPQASSGVCGAAGYALPTAQPQAPGGRDGARAPGETQASPSGRVQTRNA